MHILEVYFIKCWKWPPLTALQYPRRSINSCCTFSTVSGRNIPNYVTNAIFEDIKRAWLIFVHLIFDITPKKVVPVD